MYVLDTNAASALMRGDEAFLRRLAREEKQDVVVPQPVLAEIAYGIERLPRSRRKERLRQRFELICDEVTRSPWTDEVSACFGAIKARLERRGERIEDFDVAVAAHGRVANGVLVTSNRTHMPRDGGLEPGMIGSGRASPWERVWPSGAIA